MTLSKLIILIGAVVGMWVTASLPQVWRLPQSQSIEVAR
jgi:hypothetical protein